VHWRANCAANFFADNSADIFFIRMLGLNVCSIMEILIHARSLPPVGAHKIARIKGQTVVAGQNAVTDVLVRVKHHPKHVARKRFAFFYRYLSYKLASPNERPKQLAKGMKGIVRGIDVRQMCQCSQEGRGGGFSEVTVRNQRNCIRILQEGICELLGGSNNNASFLQVADGVFAIFNIAFADEREP